MGGASAQRSGSRIENSVDALAGVVGYIFRIALLYLLIADNDARRNPIAALRSRWRRRERPEHRSRREAG